MITIFNETRERITIADNEAQAASLPIEAGRSMAVCWAVECVFIAASRDDLIIDGFGLGEPGAAIIVSEPTGQEAIV